MILTCQRNICSIDSHSKEALINLIKGPSGLLSLDLSASLSGALCPLGSKHKCPNKTRLTISCSCTPLIVDTICTKGENSVFVNDAPLHALVYNLITIRVSSNNGCSDTAVWTFLRSNLDWFFFKSL